MVLVLVTYVDRVPENNNNNSGNYVEFLIPVVVTISEILTTPNLIPVNGKPCVLM